MPLFSLLQKKNIIIEAKCSPRSPKSKVVRFDGSKLRAKLHTRNAKLGANRELVELLSRYFGVSRDKIKITKGHKSTLKTVSIENVDSFKLAALVRHFNKNSR